MGERGTTLVEYKSRMKEGQKQIYYISGTSRAAAASSPVLERLQAKGYEVIFALDQIDEIALQGAPCRRAAAASPPPAAAAAALRPTRAAPRATQASAPSRSSR